MLPFRVSPEEVGCGVAFELRALRVRVLDCSCTRGANHVQVLSYCTREELVTVVLEAWLAVASATPNLLAVASIYYYEHLESKLNAFPRIF